MDGQADAPASLDDLASMLDTPDEQESDEALEASDADESTSDEGDTETEANDEQDVDPENPDGDDEEEPAPVEKLTIKVKGDDGQDETLEVTPEEVAASYMRQKDYTRKTQALAQRESEAVQFFTQKHEEIRSQYTTQAETLRAAVVGMAGIKSESEMAELANSDPAAWVAETNRQRQISAFIGQIDERIKAEREQQTAQMTQVQQQAKQKAYQTAWEQLSKDGIDKPKLKDIYDKAIKFYGVTQQELADLYDPRIVRALRDAAAYQELKSKKSEVVKKVQNAPRMPTRQTPPAQERRDRELNRKFATGKAKLSDLAALMR